MSALAHYRALTLPASDPTPELAAAWREKYGPLGLPTVPDPYELVLLVRRTSCEVSASGHWWSSPTPAVPSIGFGNLAPRAVLWARLRHRASGRELLVFDTHLDRRCLLPMVELFVERSQALRADGANQILLGDLNLDPATDGFRRLREAGWLDTHGGSDCLEDATFLYDLPGIPSGRIDHVLVRGAGLEAVGWSRLASPDPGIRLSDHDPVCVHLRVADGAAP